MEKVTGIGGVFFKARDPDAQRAWYEKHLGISCDWVSDGGGGKAFTGPGTTIWSIFPASSDYFSPGHATWMINYRVNDLGAMVAQLKAGGCAVDDNVQESEFGKFGWVVDPEGNRIELWEPPQ